MNSEMEYSAGLISQSFWFLEFKKVIEMKQRGMECNEIRIKCVEDNLFGVGKEYRALRMAGYVINRIKTMDEPLIELFLTSDLSTQKLINLVTILRNDRLFLEFLYEVYREKLLLGVEVFEVADVNVFFTRKESQSDLVASWNDSTKKRLRSSYLNFMTDANLLTVVGKKKMITPPILDVALERYLKAKDDGVMIKALTGVN